ncbi:hypothetical protein [uncultured Gilliamella sp.]|nr:hypothetical protein [uncultured Gilliamella sp.]
MTSSVWRLRRSKEGLRKPSLPTTASLVNVGDNEVVEVNHNENRKHIG